MIAGGGIAAIEALLAIRDLTDGAAEITLVSPEREFTYRPLLVTEPFEPEPAARRDLPALVAERHGTFVEDRLVAVDADAGTAETLGSGSVAFDHAVIAVGARLSPVLASAHTLFFESPPTSVDTILDRAEERGALDLIVPGGVTWSLPLYEFALLSARRRSEREETTPIRITTPEQSALAVFGPAASSEVEGLLAARGIELRAGVRVAEGEGGALAGAGGEPDLTGYAVALPGLEGIAIEGLPADDRGFTPVDDRCRVHGLQRIYAAGDGTDFPIKQGGLATQQADVAAASIAAAMGLGEEPEPFSPVLRGKLLTGAESVNMRTPLTGGAGEGVVSSDYLWWPPCKVSGRWLAPFLAHGTEGADPEPPDRSVDVEVSLPPADLPSVLGAIGGDSPAS